VSLQDDLSNDYAWREDVETVSVQDVSDVLQTVDATVSAVGGGETRNESGDTEMIDKIWTIFAKSIAFAPGIGDIITDAAGVQWTIAVIQPVKVGTIDYQYTCTTRKQV
jgi:hypothetical protein